MNSTEQQFLKGLDGKLWKTADKLRANPPFNMKDWWSESLADDMRWQYGTPPQGSANFAWIQHILHHLAPTGSLANGSMSSNNKGEIRKRLIEEDLVECMVTLPGQLFTNPQIPACIWFLTKDKANSLIRDRKKSNRQGEFLFIDARELGYMRDRVLRDFTSDDIAKTTDTYHAWQSIAGHCEEQGDAAITYQNIPGFCYSASLEEIAKHNYVLTPDRYVGAPEQEDDGEPFTEKMQRLKTQLAKQLAESETLEEEIRKNLTGLGYSLAVKENSNV